MVEPLSNDTKAFQKLRPVRSAPEEEVAARPAAKKSEPAQKETKEEKPEEEPAEEQAETLKQASEDGTPFCEECEKARQEEAASKNGDKGSA